MSTISSPHSWLRSLGGKARLVLLVAQRPVPAGIVQLQTLAEEECLIRHPAVPTRKASLHGRTKTKKRRKESLCKNNSLLLNRSSPRSGAFRRKGTWPGPGLLPCTPSCRLGRTHAGRMTSPGPPGGHDTPHMCLAADPLPLLPAASSELLQPLGLRRSGPPGRGGPQPATDTHTVRCVHSMHSMHSMRSIACTRHTQTQTHTCTQLDMCTACTACGLQPASDTCIACTAHSPQPTRNMHTVRHLYSMHSMCLTACFHSWTHAQQLIPSQHWTYVQSDKCTACTACVPQLVCTAGRLHSVYSVRSTAGRLHSVRSAACNRCL